MTPLIEFRDVYKTYAMGDNIVRAVDGISLQIRRGEFVAIVGQTAPGNPPV
jgi:ABC-type lipoprotein export system ATPase subunit